MVKATVITLDADGKVMTIQLRQIERIMGNPEYILDDNAIFRFLGKHAFLLSKTR